jgi:SAM-dependent methyltransferase
MKRLNLGCGHNHLSGYINVDKDPNCNPDVLADLEDILPFDDNSVDEIIMNHSLEHLGQSTEGYLNIWKELYRILKNQGTLKITVPHWNHENFHHDPTHVRKVTPTGVNMFNQRNNMDTIESNGQETTLGLQLGIDIAVMNVGYDYSPWFQELLNQKLVTEQESNRYNNACFQIQIHAKAFKPARSLL